MKKNTRLALIILGSAIVVAAVAIIAVTQFGIFGTGSKRGHPTRMAHIPALHGQSYGSWILTCGNTAKTQNKCALVMRAVDKKSGRIVLSLAVTRGPKGNPILVASVPPDVMIPAGVIIKPGNAKPLRSGFQVCNRQRCEAVFLINDALHKALVAADQTGVRFMLAGRHPFGVKLPTKDFDNAYNAWTAKSPAPAPAQPPSGNKK